MLTRNQSQNVTESVILSRGKHTLTLGMQYGRNDFSTETQQNGRGTFNFTGEATSQFGANGMPVQGHGSGFRRFPAGLAAIRFDPI